MSHVKASVRLVRMGKPLRRMYLGKRWAPSFGKAEREGLSGKKGHRKMKLSGIAAEPWKKILARTKACT